MAVLFGLYVYAGHFILKPELQWSTVSGQIIGRRETAATIESTPAKAAEAAAVTTAQKEAEVAPAIKIAEGSAAAKVEPEVEIARRKAEIDLARDIAAAKAKAQIDVAKHDALTRIEVAKAAEMKAAQAYQDCVARAQQTADGAANAQLSQNAPGVLARAETARMLALTPALEGCEKYKPQEAAAIDTAKGTAATAKNRN